MNLTFFLRVLFVLVPGLNFSYCYNILVIYGHPGKSHYDVFNDMFQLLAERGHNLTILSHVPSPLHKNIRHILLRDTNPLVHDVSLKYSRKSGILYVVDQLNLLAKFAKLNCEHDLQTQQFKTFLQEEHDFDLIVGEMFNTVCYDGLGTKYNVPFIGLSSCTYLPWHSDFFGIPFNPAYMQSILLGTKSPMSFLSRVENTVTHFFANIWFQFSLFKEGQYMSKKYIGYEAADPHKASLLLANTHYTLNEVTPLPPNVIEIAGLHLVNKSPKKLPEDIANWINNADRGVIYFSLGSMIKGDTFPEEQRTAFIRAFRKLPQRVLWKWENETMPDKPDNVMISKWMPQFDILSHSNVKAFISHGGMLGTIEAVYNGVPIIAMPQFGDQVYNAHRLESKGAGVVLDLNNVTDQTISEALTKVLDPQMAKSAKLLSEEFRDRPMSPMDSAIYWVEHVAKHKGALHMRSEAINMPFFQYYLLDVIAFLSVIIAVTLVSLYNFFRLIFKLSLRLSNKDKQKIN